MKKIFIILALLLFLPLSAEENNILYEQGIEAFNSGNYGSAELIFKKLINERNHDLRDRAWFHLARSIYQQKKYSAAVFEFNKFLNNCRTPSLAIESRFWIAEAYFNQKEYIKAIEEYKRFANQSRDRDMNALSHNRIAAIYYSQGRYDEAVLEWDKSVSFTADPVRNAQWILNIGRAHFQNRKYDEAIQRLNPLLTSKADPRIVSLARIITAEINQINNNHRAALLILNGIPESLLKEPQISNALYLKARSNIELGNTAAAKNLLSLFLHTGRDSEYYYHALLDSALISIEQNETEKGIEALETVRKNAADKNVKARASRSLSRIYVKSDPQKAIPYLEESLSDSSASDDDREALLLLARAYINMSDHVRAETSLLKIIEKYPFDRNIDEVYFLLGRVYLIKGDLLKSEEHFNYIKRNSPFSKRLNEIPYYEGQIFFKNEKYTEAVRSLSSYLAKRNTEFTFEARVLLHESYMRLDDRRNSEKIINEIIRFHQKNDRVEEVIFVHAEYLMRNRLNPETYLERIVRQYPESPDAIKSLYLIGELNFNVGRYIKAADYLGKYLAGGSVDKKNTAYLLFIISQKNLKNYSSIAEQQKSIDLSSYEGDDRRLALSVFAEAAFKLNDYAGTYELLKMEQLPLYEDQIILYFIESAVRTGNITAAEVAAEETKGKPELYGDALFKLAEQCAIAGNTLCAEKGYSLFLAEIEKHPDRERAVIGLAGIHLYNGSYETAASYASMAVSPAMRPEVTAILILTDFYTGKEHPAAAASRKNIFLILKSSYAERILYMNTERFRKSDDMSGFLFFAGHLKKFKGYDSYILFHTAEMNYARGGFRTALPSYVKLTSDEGPYKILSLFRSAGIHLFINKNVQVAEKAYLEIYSMPDIDIQYKNRSALELILIYRETGRHEDETRILDENRPEYTRDIFSVQISNLIDTTASNGDIIK